MQDETVFPYKLRSKVNKVTRKGVQSKIDALHAEINRLVENEKKYWDKKNPDVNSLQRSIIHTSIEVRAWSPTMRERYDISDE